jgi:hypothetical protein
MELDAKTLTGDIRDFLLTWLRGMKQPFNQMEEERQLAAIEAVEGMARHLVGGVINVVAGHGFPRAIVRIGAFTVKEGLEAKLISQRSERNLINFNAFAGKSAVLIFADPDEFDGQRAPAKVDKRQADLEEIMVAASEPGQRVNPRPAPPGDLDPKDPGEPAVVTINDDAPPIGTSMRDPFDEEPELGNG